MQAFEFCTQMIVMMGAGLLAGKLGMADDAFTKRFSDVLTKILIPCMAVSVMIKRYSPDALSMGTAMMGGCLLVLFVGAAVAVFVLLIRRKHDDLSAILVPCVMFINANFVGFPVIQALYGEEALVYANFFMVPYRLLFYTMMPMLFKGISGSCPKDVARSALRAAHNPGVYAAVGGLAIAMLEVPVPGALLSAVSCLGDAALPLGMMACGMYISHIHVRDTVFNSKCILAIFCRNFVTPALVWGILTLIDIDRVLLGQIVIFAALPVPSMAALFAKQYGRNAELAASMVFASTAVSIVTLPMWGELLARFS